MMLKTLLQTGQIIIPCLCFTCVLIVARKLSWHFCLALPNTKKHFCYVRSHRECKAVGYSKLGLRWRKKSLGAKKKSSACFLRLLKLTWVFLSLKVKVVSTRSENVRIGCLEASQNSSVRVHCRCQASLWYSGHNSKHQRTLACNGLHLMQTYRRYKVRTL